MKKLLTIVIIMLFGLLAFTGCEMLTARPEEPGGNVNEPTPLEKVIEKYGHIDEATIIDHEIKIVRGALIQYESKKHYEKQESEYAVSGTVRTLNELDAESAYTEQTVSETLPAGTFEVTLNLSSVYFQDFEVEDGTLKAIVWNGNADAVFGIREDLPAPIYNLSLTIETDETHVTRIGVEYGTTNNSTVTINIVFKY